MANSCGNLSNKYVTLPDNCGKLTLNQIKSNWAAVYAMLDWIKGFLNFCIPGKKQCQTNILNGQTELAIVNPNNYTIPEDNSIYCFLSLFWNGQKIPGGDGSGMNPFTLDFQWSIQKDGADYKIMFFDKNNNPLPMGTVETPCTIQLEWTPQLRIGSYFCTQLVIQPSQEGSCGC